MDKAMARDVSVEVPEKLGSFSVFEAGASNSGLQIRTSARVHKKMRLDPSLASDRKDSESKDDDGQIVDTKDGKSGKSGETKSNAKSSEQTNSAPSTLKLKRSSPSWSTEEKETFFQALNEYGKDFESIQSVFVTKAHDKNLQENLVKSKEQIRLFYYRTWHKLSKYLKFSPDVKRAIQELYALINYGEFLKHCGLLTEKTCVKLHELIHRGHATVRVRGKHIRLKTPQCPALQKLNRLDVPEWKEELQLPSRVIVELRPRTAGDWCRVQSVAQNPRVRAFLPLEQRLSSLLAFLQQRWRPPLLQHRDKLLSSLLLAKLQLEVRADHAKEPPPLLHMAPPLGVRITLPTFCLSEYLTSSSLSLAAYRERLANREALPTLPRRMPSSVSRTRNRNRVEPPKINMPPAETSNHKKPSVLGKDVEALVAAAAAAAAACEAKAKASAAISGQTVDTSCFKDGNISTSVTGTSSASVPVTTCVVTSSSTSVGVLLSNTSANKTAVTTVSTANDICGGTLVKGLKTSSVASVQVAGGTMGVTTLTLNVKPDTISESVSLGGKSSTDASCEVTGGVETEAIAGLPSEPLTSPLSGSSAEQSGGLLTETTIGPTPALSAESSVGSVLGPAAGPLVGPTSGVSSGVSSGPAPGSSNGPLLELEGETEVETEVQLEAESEAESEAEAEVLADTEAEVQTETEFETPVGTETDIKAENKVEVKLRAQIRREKAAARLEAVRQGWSLENSRAVSIGELYLMFGHDGKVELDYWWEERAPPEQKTLISEGGEASAVAFALQKLVSITKLNYRKSKLLCPCGHVCGTPTKTNTRSKSSGKNSKESLDKAAGGAIGSHMEKIAPKPPQSLPPTQPPPPPPPPAPRAIPHHMLLPTVQDGVFRRPLLAPMYRTGPRSSEVEAIKAQLEKFRPKYCNRRGRTVRQKGVVVQRMLPLLPKVPDGHPMLALKVIPQTTSKMAGEFIPIRPQPEGFTLSQQPKSSLHIRPTETNLRRQQPFIKPKLFTTTPVAIATNMSALECQKDQHKQQKEQVVAVSISHASSTTNLQPQFSGSLSSTDQPGEVELMLVPKEDDPQPSSPPPMSSPPPSISHLLDLDLGSTVGDDISLSGVSCGLLDAALVASSTPSASQTFSGLLSDEVSEQCPGSPSLMKLSDQHWLNSEVGDFSLSSLLGHLDSPAKSIQTSSAAGEDTRLPDVEAQLQCLMSENSVDYSAKFAVLAAQVAASAENKK